MRRPCAHQPEDPPETISSGGDGGLSEREERAAAVRRESGPETPDWSRQDVVARGYYVSTVGLNESVIRQYIKDQEEADQFGGE